MGGLCPLERERGREREVNFVVCYALKLQLSNFSPVNTPAHAHKHTERPSEGKPTLTKSK